MPQTEQGMRGVICIVVGLGLVLAATWLLVAWVGGRTRRFRNILFKTGKTGITESADLWFYFLIKVLVPLLVGAVLVAYGLREL